MIWELTTCTNRETPFERRPWSPRTRNRFPTQSMTHATLMATPCLGTWRHLGDGEQSPNLPVPRICIATHWPTQFNGPVGPFGFFTKDASSPSGMFNNTHDAPFSVLQCDRHLLIAKYLLAEKAASNCCSKVWFYQLISRVCCWNLLVQKAVVNG